MIAPLMPTEIPAVADAISLEDAMRQLREQQSELARLKRAQALDLEDVDRIRAIASVWRPAEIAAHVREVVAAAPVQTDPFAHLVLEPLLPPDAFQVLVDAVPPEEFFEGEKHLDLRGIGKTTTVVPLFSRIIWCSLRNDVINCALAPALAEKLRPFARDLLRHSMGDEFVEEAVALPLHPHGLRLMLRRRGWTLRPHCDPRDQFISTLLYLAPPGQGDTYGTQLFRVLQENFVPGWANTYYPEDEGVACELAKTMPYRGNLCLSFLNLGGGAHGASVPEDAQPPDLRRLAFQFYMGPDREQLDPIIARLRPDLQLAWTRRVKHEERRAMRKAAAGRQS
jgi:hypothetical protein